VATVNPDVKVPQACMHMYSLAFPVGLAISGTIYYGLCWMWPVQGAGEYDGVDYFGTFTEREAESLGVVIMDEVREEKLDEDVEARPPLEGKGMQEKVQSV
jgi:nucleobase:cation symporter-1, NCS1 family